jgi:L-2-hydroxyglutarate oxidase LhgO
MNSVDCVVVGAGVMGLSIARELALAGRETVIVERHAGIGEETSSRNSEVVHAGLYYPPGSLKAQTCRRGRDLLYRYCHERGIPHRLCGKLIVATETNQLSALASLRSNAVSSGVNDLVELESRDVRVLEPEINCVAALLSPSTGIIDSHEFLLALLADAEQHGAVLVGRSTVLDIEPGCGGIDVRIGQRDVSTLRTRWLINTCGLEATSLACRIRGFPMSHVPRTYYAKGNYFALPGRAPFSRLVYPIPVAGGLGVHLTLDLGNRARFGPDVEWVDRVDYTIDLRRSDDFYQAIRRYWPALRDGVLQPAYCGVRPKLSGPGEAVEDFRIDSPSRHGVPGIINLFGIESPGLTASLALAERVAQVVRDS